jgi:hypothetical protein
MNPTITPEFTTGLTFDLRSFVALCENVLALATRENRALVASQDYQPGEFHQQRQQLLPKLETTLSLLKQRRLIGQQNSPAGGHTDEIKSLFQTIQSLVMKILFLDRENQQALLRLGLVPPKHLPPVAAQQPNFVAGLYQRHSPV